MKKHPGVEVRSSIHQTSPGLSISDNLSPQVGRLLFAVTPEIPIHSAYRMKKVRLLRTQFRTTEENGMPETLLFRSGVSES